MAEEELPDPGLRIITILVKPGEDPEVSYDGFAYYEVKSALHRVFELIEDEEELGFGIKFTPEEGTDGEEPE